MDALQIVPRFFVETGRRILLQDLAEARHAAQGSAQVVRDGVGESFELAVRSFQLARTFGDAALQVRVGAPHFVARFDERRHGVATAPLVATQRDVQQDRGADDEQPAFCGLQLA